MLFAFMLAYGFAAVADAYWSGGSLLPVVAYGIAGVATVACIAWAIVTRADDGLLAWVTASLVGLHFVVFGFVRLQWTAAPVELQDAALVSRVMFYFAAASTGYLLACVVYCKTRREAVFASIPAGVLMLAGAWHVLNDAIDSYRVVTSLGMSFGLVILGLVLFEVGRLDAVRRCFSNRPQNELAGELRQAKRVHESMFPEPIASHDFRFGYAYRPMRQIGGDFIHIHRRNADPHDAEVFYLTLIDVTGHGITSALTVNRLQAELQQYFASARTPCPAEALGHLNEYIRVTMAEHGLFATGMCVKIDSVAGTLTLANAGHPHSYFRDSSGLREIEAEGPMLGVFPGDAFDATPVTLSYAAGDQLVMVTDGAIESRSPSDEPIGTARLHRIIERACREIAPPDGAPSSESLLQRRMTDRLLDRADVRKPVGLIQQVLRQGMNAHPCALADEIMLSIDDFVQQESQDDILIATIELLQTEPGEPVDADATKPAIVGR
jgi:hypothetical protein